MKRVDVDGDAHATIRDSSQYGFGGFAYWSTFCGANHESKPIAPPQTRQGRGRRPQNLRFGTLTTRQLGKLSRHPFG
jgi:hypothetical protein